jgi:hypothetical protein
MYNSGTNSEIKPLQIYFKGRGEVKGYLFTLLGMTDKAFLYEVSRGDGKHYEVFIKKINRRFACVSYPTSKSFGIWAWTFEDIKSAIKKFNEIIYEN